MKINQIFFASLILGSFAHGCEKKENFSDKIDDSTKELKQKQLKVNPYVLLRLGIAFGKSFAVRMDDNPNKKLLETLIELIESPKPLYNQELDQTIERGLRQSARSSNLTYEPLPLSTVIGLNCVEKILEEERKKYIEERTAQKKVS